MQKLNIEPTPITPAIRFSPDENVFFIRGKSSPEDSAFIWKSVPAAQNETTRIA